MILEVEGLRVLVVGVVELFDEDGGGYFMVLVTVERVGVVGVVPEAVDVDVVVAAVGWNG